MYREVVPTNDWNDKKKEEEEKERGTREDRNGGGEMRRRKTRREQLLQFVARETENDIAARYRSVSGGSHARGNQ